MIEYFKIVLKYISPYKRYAFLNIFFNLSGVVFALLSTTLVIPFLQFLFKNDTSAPTYVPFSFTIDSFLSNFYYIIQKIAGSDKGSALVIVSILVILMFFFKTLSIYMANYFMAPLRNNVIRDLRNKMYDRILILPLSYFTESRKGDIISRISGDVLEVEWSIMSSLEMAFRDPVNIIIFITALFIMSPSLTVFVFILLPVGGFIIGYIGKTLRKTSMKGQVKMGEIMSMIEETLSGIRIIKAFNAQNIMRDKFYFENNNYTAIANRIMRKRYLASPLSEFLGAAIMVTIMWYGGSLVLGGNYLRPEVFLAYLAVFFQLLIPAKSLTSAYYAIQKGMASIDRINQIIAAEEVILEKENAIPVNTFNSEIEYTGVTFCYEKTEVLKDIRLKIKKGKSVALVGQSGSGKTTIANLLPRFYDIDEGNILIDGTQIKNFKIKDLRGLMGIVSQDAVLFNDTFFSNIAFGTENVKEEDVIAAAKVANAHEFIISTEKGYYTNIGDSGSKLSGGQRQRISIARAVLKNPPILILDEATSALDTESERLVQDALTNLMKNRTSIIIAHRLSTIKNADEICVLKEGKIVERGTHDELIERNGLYSKLYYLQS
ncbi:MAG: ATP-binding cassette domain-containing protein [Bacteroidia bacterium]|nr:ATP-binding cassette domain-containing protein [Bacteroidia bacterium]